VELLAHQVLMERQERQVLMVLQELLVLMVLQEHQRQALLMMDYSLMLQVILYIHQIIIQTVILMYGANTYYQVHQSLLEV